VKLILENWREFLNEEETLRWEKDTEDVWDEVNSRLVFSRVKSTRYGIILHRYADSHSLFLEWVLHELNDPMAKEYSEKFSNDFRARQMFARAPGERAAPDKYFVLIDGASKRIDPHFYRSLQRRGEPLDLNRLAKNVYSHLKNIAMDFPYDVFPGEDCERKLELLRYLPASFIYQPFAQAPIEQESRMKLVAEVGEDDDSPYEKCAAKLAHEKDLRDTTSQEMQKIPGRSWYEKMQEP
tara:strand:- start:166 stop:882 length:717 start_codon:yes stop_codon:yes gene_type:complete